jgi:hypothetical protein
MVLVSLLRWHACMLRELPSVELLYRSYRLQPTFSVKTKTNVSVKFLTNQNAMEPEHEVHVCTLNYLY